MNRQPFWLCFVFGLLVTAATVFAGSGGARVAPATATAAITVERSRQHIDLLADDRMMGRNTPSPELEMAAEYIAAQFRAYGLEPVNGSYFHEYTISRKSLGDTNTLNVGRRTFSLKKDFIPLSFSGSAAVRGTVVFVGYGLSRPDSGYDDYAGVDVRGKIVMVVEGEPKRSRSSKRGWRVAKDARSMGKMQTAARHGAAGILIMANPVQYRILRPTGYWPSMYKSNGEFVPLPYALDPLETGSAAIPSLSISGDVASIIVGSLDRIVDVVTTADETGRSVAIESKTTISLQTSINIDKRTVRNVVGMIRGSRLPDEYVIIGAHYDHVGHGHLKKGQGGAQDSIYNGADDNASGTTGLLLNAEAFGRLSGGERPLRSVIVLAFSGEEKGLFGSRAWVANPPIPNSSVVAMLNMDMIGRNFRDSVSVAGQTRSPELAAIMEDANRQEPMAVTYNLESMFYRSDQASFANQKIPVIFFSSGDHIDYHQVTDSPDKIDNVKLAHIARLCFRTAWGAAEAAARPAFVNAGVEDFNAMILLDD